MQENDLGLLSTTLRHAGTIALGFFKADPKTWDKGGGAGPVTEADLAVNDYLERTFTTARPDYAWLSEETEDTTDRLTKDHVFIVDPIDGTRAFIEGNSHWSHSVAIAQKGQVETAAVYLPVTDMMFTAQRGKGAFLNGQPINVSERNQINGATILSAKSNFDAKHWPSGFPDIERAFRSSLAYRLCLVAEGAFDGMLTLRPTWEWDVAAGSLIVQEAGGRVTNQRGDRPVFNNPTPQLNGMVAANTPVHQGLLTGLTPPVDQATLDITI